MLCFESVKIGTVIRLEHGDEALAIAGCRRIPAGTYRVTNVYQSFVSRTHKREHDTIVEVVKISKGGKPIGNYTYNYAIHFFMKRGILVE